MQLAVTWLGHSTAVLRLDGAVVVTDPLLGRRNGPLRRRGPTPREEQWSDAQAVLLSHLHHDHAELSSLARLPGVPVLTAPGNARWLRGKGMPGVALADGSWHRVGDTEVRVRLVRADHHDRPMPHRPNEANGHLLVGPSGRVWIAGDTAFYDDMAAIPDLAGGPVDLALVPVGGWGPRLSGGHLNAATAARACALVKARAAIPVHWGTLYLPGTRTFPRGWLRRPGPMFVDSLAREAPGCTPFLLSPGQTVELPA